MNEAVFLILRSSGRVGSVRDWPHGRTRVTSSLAELRSALDREVAEGEAEWVLIWDPELGSPPAQTVDELMCTPGDAFHAGLLLGAAGQPDDLDLVHPNWYFTLDPPADARAISWRLTLDALLIRVEVLRQLGGIDPVFRTWQAAGLDLGWRLLRRGALLVHEPSLVSGLPASAPSPASLLWLDPVDRYALLTRHLAPKWVRYVASRRALASFRPTREYDGMRRGMRAAGDTQPALPPGAWYQRPSLPRPKPLPVSVVLPTLGRYELVGRVLDDLRMQTVAPAEIICIDQTKPHDPLVFERHRDLPLTVVAQEGLGQWLARNEAVRRARHDLLLFLDDDSHVPPEFVEHHLACLNGFRAEISAGASRSVVGAPVPENYGFYRVADQFDSGNALVRRSLLARIGAFDQQFDRMRSGDAEFGLRAHLAGAVSIHNPAAYRLHFKAAEGGLRSFGSWDLFRQRGWLSPLPLPSVLYFGMRYFTSRQRRESLLIGLSSGIIPYDRKRRATWREWLRHGLLAGLTLPVHGLRVGRSMVMARQMLAAGPKIPPVNESAPTAAP